MNVLLEVIESVLLSLLDHYVLRSLVLSLLVSIGYPLLKYVLQRNRDRYTRWRFPNLSPRISETDKALGLFMLGGWILLTPIFIWLGRNQFHWLDTFIVMTLMILYVSLVFRATVPASSLTYKGAVLIFSASLLVIVLANDGAWAILALTPFADSASAPALWTLPQGPDFSFVLSQPTILSNALLGTLGWAGIIFSLTGFWIAGEESRS